MAPFTPFFTETMYVNLVRALPSEPAQPASVHFCPFPEADLAACDDRIERSVDRMATVIELARVIRERHARSVKVPVRAITVVHPDADFLADLSSQLAEYVTEEVNALSLQVSADVASFCSLRCEPKWAVLGKRLGKAMSAVAAGVKDLSAEAIGEMERTGSITVAGHTLALEDVTIVREFKKPSEEASATVLDAAGDGDVLVVLDLTLDSDLADAGTARECVARVQKARKAAGLAPSDGVHVTLGVIDAEVARALQAKAQYVSDALGTAPQVVVAAAPDAAIGEEAAAGDAAVAKQVSAAIAGKGAVVFRESTELSSGAALEIVLCKAMADAQL
jgi:isoleucyl-tRNA synthetase